MLRIDWRRTHTAHSDFLRAPRNSLAPPLYNDAQLRRLVLVKRTIHKTQALSIKHTVRGALEGIFAQGELLNKIVLCVHSVLIHACFHV